MLFLSGRIELRERCLTFWEILRNKHNILSQKDFMYRLRNMSTELNEHLTNIQHWKNPTVSYKTIIKDHAFSRENPLNICSTLDYLINAHCAFIYFIVKFVKKKMWRPLAGSLEDSEFLWISKLVGTTKTFLSIDGN